MEDKERQARKPGEFPAYSAPLGLPGLAPFGSQGDALGFPILPRWGLWGVKTRVLGDAGGFLCYLLGGYLQEPILQVPGRDLSLGIVF